MIGAQLEAVGLKILDHCVLINLLDNELILCVLNYLLAGWDVLTKNKNKKLDNEICSKFMNPEKTDEKVLYFKLLIMKNDVESNIFYILDW